MKILVPVKRVVDHSIRVRVLQDESNVDIRNVKMSMNPFDEVALEAALRLKESGHATEVIAVSIGEAVCADTLRTAIAMGADRAILLETPVKLESLGVAKLLKVLCGREHPDLVLCGKQASDSDAAQTGPMLAALLDWPQVTYVSAISAGEGKLVVEREIDGGAETVEVSEPCVLTADLRLNVPRFTTLPNILKAKKKPIETIVAADFGVDIAPKLSCIKMVEPNLNRKAEILATPAVLVKRLLDAGVLR